MGNTHVKPYPRTRNKKQVHWKAASRPSPPGKPSLASPSGANFVPDVVKICWTKSEKDGGSPITGYLVEHKRTGSPHWVRASPLMVQIEEIAVSGLEPGWRYQFRVRAENAVGLSDPSEPSEPLTVTLQRSAITAPKFIQELAATTALEDAKVEFTVLFLGQPAPTICWYKDGFEIFSSRRTRIVTEQDRSILTIHQCSLADEGEIKCTATNRAGHTATKAKLTLEAPPKIRLPRQYEDGIIFEMGEDIKLKVTIAGRPTPLVFWSHDGESLQNDERREIEYADDCSLVRVAKATRGDRGEYQIRAVNKLGQDVASFLVTVTDKPTPPGKARVVMTLGRSVTLSWNSPDDDGGCQIGNYIVEYYRVGWNVWLKAATSRKLTTILGDLIEGSEYKFRIKAESPYGVSDPSEESDSIFIPDRKRGILQPQDVTRTPSPDAENKKQQRVKFAEDEPAPKRPERLKIKTKTPEASPRLKRKSLSPSINRNSPVDVINTLNFDRPSLARELAYGIPETKTKPQIILPPKSDSPLDSDSNSPVQTPETALLNLSSRKDSLRSFDINERNVKSPSPSSTRKRRSSFKQRNFSGSSEFMLVLCPDDEEGDKKRIFHFEENSIPPPMSLSAPELGEDIDRNFKSNLVRSASSSELFNYRLLDQLNNENHESKTDFKSESRRTSMEVPTIQINSKDDQPIVGLDSANLKRRASDGTGLAHNKFTSRERKNSLNYDRDIAINKLSESVLSKSKLADLNQRSLSQEREEEEFAKVRERMKLNHESKKSVEVADEDKWLMDYEESISSDEESETSLDERKHTPIEYYEEEEETYHPRQMIFPQITKSPSDPFEILTVKKDLPDPNLVPKPILKKTTDDAIKTQSPPKNLHKKERSFSLINDETTIEEVRKFKPKNKRRAFSLLPGQAAAIKENFKVEKSEVNPAMNISALAKLSSIAGAGIIIPKTMSDKKDDEEEAKVVVDFYGDIVRSYGNKGFGGSFADKIKKYEIKDEINEKDKDDKPIEPIKEHTFEEKNTDNLVKNEIKEEYPVVIDSALKTFKQVESEELLNDVNKQLMTLQETKFDFKFEDKTLTKSPVRSTNPGTKRVHRRSTSRTRSSSSVRQPSITRNEMSRPSSRNSELKVRPKLKEITTQTSFRMDFIPLNFFKNEELSHRAEKKVRGFLEYSTDFSLLILACWLYFFKSEFYAIPILIILAYRQIEEEFKRCWVEFKAKMRRTIPDWILRKFDRS